MKKHSFSLIIAGVGGQGNILASHIVAEAGLEAGYGVTIAETYGGAMRGGPVFSLIKMGKTKFSPLISENSLDILVGLEPLEALRQGVRYLSTRGTAIVNVKPIMPLDVKIGKVKYPNVGDIISSLSKLCKQVIHFNAEALAEDAGNMKAANVVLLGALIETRLLPISVENLKQAIMRRVPEGTEKVNLKAFELGRTALKKASHSSNLRRPSTH